MERSCVLQAVKIWQEQHISADIAWGVWLYYQATGDDDFMNRRGCELLIEIARFWAISTLCLILRSNTA